MQKQIIVINGTGGSGKDKFVEMFSHYQKTFNFSSIDKVKEIARLMGWKGTKSEKDRKFLSDLKRLTTEYNDLSFHSIEEAVAYFKSAASDEEVMFIHIREPEEIARAVTFFGAKTLLIKRAGLQNINSNASDANVENYAYDYVIENTTLENLNNQALYFSSQLKLKQNRNLKLD